MLSLFFSYPELRLEDLEDENEDRDWDDGDLWLEDDEEELDEDTANGDPA
jgi:hypothetical protein